jgi:hypothetical protein
MWPFIENIDRKYCLSHLHEMSKYEPPPAGRNAWIVSQLTCVRRRGH